MGGGKGQQEAQKVPVQTPSGYTSFDGGGTWVEDPNTHFVYDDKHYYVEPGEVITDKSAWKEDTMAGWHKTYSPTERAAEKDAAQVMYNEQLSTLEAQKRAYAAQQEALEKAEAEAAAEEAELEAKKQRRLTLAAQGSSPTILTSGKGLTDQANTRKKKLGAG